MSSRLLLAALLLQEAAAFTYQQSGYWETSDCSDAPFYMDIFPEANCGQLNITYNCSPYTFNSTEYYRTVICVEDTQVWTKSYYKSTDYVLVEQFDTSSSDCDEYFEGRVFLANESCIKMINSTSYQSAIASVGSDDAQTLKLYTDNKCSTTAAKSFSIESSVVADHSCYDSEYKFFSESEYTSGSGSYSGSESESASQSNGASASASESASASGGVSGSSASSAGSSSGSTVEGVVGDSSGSRLGTGIIVVIVVVAVVVALGIGWLIFWFGRRSAGRKQRENGAPLSDKEDGFVNMNAVPSRTVDDMFTSESDGDGSPLWRDEAILGARVPREKVAVQQLISRGGYGEVYVGTYNGQQVAVKMLLPETRKSKVHRISFLAEVKLMATLEHPRIVHLVGVAWDSPNDLCALIEFMSGGDLRTLLNKYEAENRPSGFTYEKVKIALHVAHALTYLHSLDPPVIHRDLKSKNILLSKELDAKLTDFGISRERVDRTMTAAVGTSLWMSPEVMMGERYNDKADIFSFGVVLSELNTHSMPYAHAKSRDGSGGRLPDTAILQLVAAGRLRADFSQGGQDALMQLGLACVSVDPKARPSAPEVLYHLQTAMKDMSSR
uniref:Protein kinase domain-containing protein n=1 Tax=Phytophthora ramorum TaxID=164328 RepID=H3GYV8_PHYRM